MFEPPAHRSAADPPAQVRPRKLTADRLERSVLSYVARFVTSEARLVAFIERKIDRWAKKGGEVLVDDAAKESLIQKCRKRGYVDDVRFAEVRIARWYRAGNARRAIVQKLRAEKLDEQSITAALENFRASHTDVVDIDHLDRAAAEQYARKRSLGPYRQKDRVKWRARDLAKMGRRGFSFEDARAIIDAEQSSTRYN